MTFYIAENQFGQEVAYVVDAKGEHVPCPLTAEDEWRPIDAQAFCLLQRCA